MYRDENYPDDTPSVAQAAPAPAPVSPAPSVASPTVSALTGVDPGAVASEFQRGAQSSVPAGIGLAARETVMNPVSKVVGPLVDAGVSANRLGMAALKTGYEGVRAFLTGNPAAPTTPPASTALPAPPAVPAQTGTVAPVQTQNFEPETPLPFPVKTYEAPGGLTVGSSGNQVAIVGNPQQPQVQTQALAPSYSTSVRIQPPQPVTDVNVRRAGASSALGNAFATAAGLAAVKTATAQQQTLYKNQLKASEETRHLLDTQATVGQKQASTAQTQEQTRKLADDREREATTQRLRTQIVAEPDPKKRAELERQLQAIMGKRQSNVQIVTKKSVDPATGLPVETPYVIDEAGNAREAVPKPALLQNPQAMAVVNDAKLSREDKVKKLQALGYE